MQGTARLRVGCTHPHLLSSLHPTVLPFSLFLYRHLFPFLFFPISTSPSSLSLSLFILRDRPVLSLCPGCVHTPRYSGTARMAWCDHPIPPYAVRGRVVLVKVQLRRIIPPRNTVATILVSSTFVEPPKLSVVQTQSSMLIVKDVNIITRRKQNGTDLRKVVD